ncbi:hypothetical protein EXW51_28780 (plasmid) [Bacillus mycoides]|nr:hypothetical protein EXW51_28780 [Bacillus mycoides]
MSSIGIRTKIASTFYFSTGNAFNRGSAPHCYQVKNLLFPKTIKINFGIIKTQNLHLGGTLKS